MQNQTPSYFLSPCLLLPALGGPLTTIQFILYR